MNRHDDEAFGSRPAGKLTQALVLVAITRVRERPSIGEENAFVAFVKRGLVEVRDGLLAAHVIEPVGEGRRRVPHLLARQIGREVHVLVLGYELPIFECRFT